MDCNQAEPLLGAFIDGELGDEQAASLERHVAGCTTCIGRERRLRQIIAAFRELPRLRPSVDFEHRVRTRELVIGGSGFWIGLSALAASVALLALQPKTISLPAQARPQAGIKSFGEEEPPRHPNMVVPTLAGMDCGLAGPAACRIETPCAEPSQCMPVAAVAGLEVQVVRGREVSRLSK